MTVQWSALVPVGASTVVVALSIILLASGTTPTTANHNYWLSVNVSRIGQGLVRITPLNTSSREVALTSSYNRDDSPYLEQDDASPCLFGNLRACFEPPAFPTPALSNPPSSSSATASSAVFTVSAILNLTNAQPSSGSYRFYATKVCQGNFVDEDSPGSDVFTTRCVSYSDTTHGLGQLVDTTNSIRSSILFGNTANISFLLVAAVKGDIVNTITVVTSSAKAIFALVVIRIMSGTLALAGSALLLIDIRRFVVFTMLTFATLANVSLLLAAGITTGVIVVQAESIKGLAEALSVEVHYGINFLVVEWVTAAFAIVGSTYWLVVWFVNFRTFALSRRSRSARQIGNWQEAWYELKQDFQGDDIKP